jgi:hypothetical protein
MFLYVLHTRISLRRSVLLTQSVYLFEVPRPTHACPLDRHPTSRATLVSHSRASTTHERLPSIRNPSHTRSATVTSRNSPTEHKTSHARAIDAGMGKCTTPQRFLENGHYRDTRTARVTTLGILLRYLVPRDSALPKERPPTTHRSLRLSPACHTILRCAQTSHARALANRHTIPGQRWRGQQ